MKKTPVNRKQISQSNGTKAKDMKNYTYNSIINEKLGLNYKQIY